jgi:hypothetical protein
MVAYYLMTSVFMSGQATLSIQDLSHTVGTTSIGIRITEGSGSTQVYCNMHDDENTAVEAALKIIRETGGKLVELRHTGRRRVAFKFEGQEYTFDPNRIFTSVGLKRTIDRRTVTEGAINEVDRFAKKLLEYYQIDTVPVLVALHNNGEGGLSINSYLPRGSEEAAAAEVHVNAHRDPDDFFLVTDRGLFEGIKAKNYNVVLQDNDRAPDDGSLSVYCGQMGIPYANVEAQLGHLDEQIDMIKILISVIKDVNPQRKIKINAK